MNKAIFIVYILTTYYMEEVSINEVDNESTYNDPLLNYFLNKKEMRALQSLSKPCIYALVHPNRKRVYLAHSINLIESLVELFKNLDNPTPKWKRLSLDRNKLLLVVLEEEINPVVRRVHLKEWTEAYLKGGYRLYNRPKYVEYKIKTVIVTVGSGLKVEVRLVNRGRGFTSIETFATMDEAKEFIGKTTLKQMIQDYVIAPSRMNEANDAGIDVNNDIAEKEER